MTDRVSSAALFTSCLSLLFRAFPARTSRSGRALLILRLFPAMLLVLSTASGQDVGKVSGVVRDAETNEPLIGCNVTILGTTLGAATDVDGAFFILNVPPGKYDIQASILGYQKVILRDAVVNAGRTTAANFNLKSAALEQKEIVIEASRPDVEREKTSTESPGITSPEP